MQKVNLITITGWYYPDPSFYKRDKQMGACKDAAANVGVSSSSWGVMWNNRETGHCHRELDVVLFRLPATDKGSNVRCYCIFATLFKRIVGILQTSTTYLLSSWRRVLVTFLLYAQLWHVWSLPATEKRRREEPPLTRRRRELFGLHPHFVDTTNLRPVDCHCDWIPLNVLRETSH
jgi:hypothetical protein